MDAILNSAGQVFTQAITWVGTVGQTIAEQPILLLYAVVPLVGIGVGLFSRLISVR